MEMNLFYWWRRLKEQILQKLAGFKSGEGLYYINGSDTLPPPLTHQEETALMDAIRRGAVTLDGVKRRVGAGLGRCQGSWCGDQVLEILTRELGISPWDVTQDGPGSPLLGGKRHEL